MFSFIAIVALVTGASGAVVPSLNIPSLENALRFSVPTGRKASRIINGEPAGGGEFSHQLSLQYRPLPLFAYQHICGASLVANNYAITAAHCVEGFSTWNLRLAGALNDLADSDTSYHFNIAEIIMHPGYNVGSGAFPNDIALLRLSHSYSDLSPYTIPLASGPYDFAGDFCFISGWGVTVFLQINIGVVKLRESGSMGSIKYVVYDDENGSSSSILMKSEVTVLSDVSCKSEWGEDNILDQHICVWGVGGNRSGSCNGDSGGPLTCNDVLAGLTSWGISGCHNDGVVEYPSVYVRVSEFRDWIMQNCNQCVFV